MTKQFDPNKPARTVGNKRPARFLGRIKTTSAYTLVYAITDHAKHEVVHIYMKDGRYSTSGLVHTLDLENIPETITSVMYQNIYRNSEGEIYRGARWEIKEDAERVIRCNSDYIGTITLTGTLDIE